MIGTLRRVRFYLAFAVCLGAFPQTFPAHQEQVFWRGADLVVATDGKLEIESRTKGVPGRSLAVPSDLKNLHCHSGFFWANKADGLRDRREVRVLRSADGHVWHPMATWKVGPDNPGCRILALSHGYLGIATTAPFRKGEERSWFALLDTQQGNGLLKVDRLLEMEVGAQTPWIFMPLLVQLQDGWAIVSNRTGHLWTIREGGAQLKIRMHRLFHSVKHAALGDLGSVEPPILGCQPQEDGTLLIASRTEEAVLKVRPLIKGQGVEPNERIDPNLLKNPSDRTLAEIDRRMDEAAERFATSQDQAQEKVLALFPEVLWWTFSPDGGTFKRIPVPVGATDRLLSLEIFRKFRFRPTAQGRLLVAY